VAQQYDLWCWQVVNWTRLREAGFKADPDSDTDLPSQDIQFVRDNALSKLPSDRIPGVSGEGRSAERERHTQMAGSKRRSLVTAMEMEVHHMWEIVRTYLGRLRGSSSKWLRGIKDKVEGEKREGGCRGRKGIYIAVNYFHRWFESVLLSVPTMLDFTLPLWALHFCLPAMHVRNGDTGVIL
jgi:hypothetical protein